MPDIGPTGREALDPGTKKTNRAPKKVDQECSFHSSSNSRSFDHLRSALCHHAAVTDQLDRVLVIFRGIV